MTNIERNAFVKESGIQAESAQLGVNLGFDVLSNGLNRDTKKVKQAFGAAAMAVMPIAGITIRSEKPVIGYDFNSRVLKYAIVTADQSPSDLGTMSPQSEKTNQQNDYAKAAERFIANQISTGGEISAKDLEGSNMTNQYVAIGRFVEKLTEGDKPLFKWTGEFGDGGLALNPMKDSVGKVHLTLFVTDKDNRYFQHVVIPNINGVYNDGMYDITDLNSAGFEKNTLPFIALDADPSKYSLTLEKSPTTYVETFRRRQFENGKIVADQYFDQFLLQILLRAI